MAWKRAAARAAACTPGVLHMLLRCLTSCPVSRTPALHRTVSADPSLHEECFKGAKFLLRILESIGWVGLISGGSSSRGRGISLWMCCWCSAA